MPEYIFSFGKFDDMVAVHIKKENNSPQIRNLVCLVDNATLHNDFGKIIHSIPTVINARLEYINYASITLICSYPKICSMPLDKNKIYSTFAKLIKPKYPETLDDNLDELINYCKHNNNLDILLVSASKLQDKQLTMLATYGSVTYLDFGAENADLNMQNILYHHATNQSTISTVIGTMYLNHATNYNCLPFIEIENATIAGTGFDKLTYYDYNNFYLLLDSKSSDKKIKIKVIIKTDNKEQITEGICPEQLDPTSITIPYIESLLELIETCTIDKKNYNSIYAITKKIKTYCQKIYQHSDEEFIAHMVSIFNNIRKIDNKLIENIKYADHDSIIQKYVEKTNKNIKNNHMKHKFNKNILKNIDRYQIYEQLFSINETEEFKKFTNDDHDNESFAASCEFFNSPITLNNWFDEIKIANSIGLLANVAINDFSKLGVSGAKANITDITLTFISIKDYMETVLMYYQTSAEQFIDLNDKHIITGMGIGKANAVIPLYINSYHWYYAKKQLPIILGIILTHNPYGYMESHINFMFYFLAEMTRRTFVQNNMFSCKWIQIYIALLRTCAQISYEKGYHKGIKKFIKNYLNTSVETLSKKPYDNYVIFGQLLSTGCCIDIDNINALCYFIYKDQIKQYICQKKGTINPDYNNIDCQLKYTIEIIAAFHNMYTIIGQLGGFKKLLNNLDDNYGLLPETEALNIMKKINKLPDNMNHTNLYKLININVPYEELFARDIDEAIAMRKPKN